MSVRYIRSVLMCSALLVSAVANSQSKPSEYTYAFRYDAMRRLTGTIAPDPDGEGPLRYIAERNTYDANGRLAKVEKGELEDWQSESTSPSAWSKFTVISRVEFDYDMLDRKIDEREYEGNSLSPKSVTQFSYNKMGLVECTAVRMKLESIPASACTIATKEGVYGQDRITRNEYDDSGDLVKKITGFGTELQQDYATYKYTLNSKNSDIIDANGNLSHLEYDGLDRISRQYFPSRTKKAVYDTLDYEEYAYDKSDNKVSSRRRDGRIIEFKHDSLNRVIQKIVPDGCAPNQISLCPPPEATRDVYYEYDIQGNLLYARFGDRTGDGVTMTYNGFGEITSSVITMDGQSKELTYEYDPHGNRSVIKYPDGQKFKFIYDGMDRLKAISDPDDRQVFSNTWNKQGLVKESSAGDLKSAFLYDDVGQIAKYEYGIKGSPVSTTLTWNPAGQVYTKEVGSPEFTFSGRYNVARKYISNAKNQYTEAGPAAFVYDDNGNLTEDGTGKYSYDAEGRLIYSSSGANLSYDPLGRLWQVSASGTSTEFLYDGVKLIAEYDKSNLLRRYLHGNGSDNPLIWYEGASLIDRRSLLADHQGSIIAVVDAAGGAMRINTYDEYGVPSANNSGRFQYTGQVFLPEIGMYYYKARIYSATLGRFLQTDPILYQDQLNLYAYVANDPVNRRDPTGQRTIYIGGGGDGYFTDIVKSYAVNRGSFYRHYQRDAALGEIRAAAANGEKIIIVGHSWGGWSAATVAGAAAREGINVDLLVTVDPVGKLSPETLGGLKKIGGLWANISTSWKNPEEKTRGDKIADLGKWSGGDAQTSRADVDEISQGHHEDFGRMMNELKAPQMICTVDRNDKSCK